jgi:hypothetical protein
VIALSLPAMVGAPSVHAHDARPAFLSLDETERGVYDVMWKVPAMGGVPLALDVEFPRSCGVARLGDVVHTSDAMVERLRLRCDAGGVSGKSIGVLGLSRTITDVFVRVASMDGSMHSAILRPREPHYIVPERADEIDVALTYGELGTRHIAKGIDHLLFIVALVLLVPNVRVLLLTVTGFTLAHSLTLTSATLGWIPHPGAATEVVIALSILMLAYEVIRLRRGVSSITSRHPWLVSFFFGLLHGFGFAGALAEIGLPGGEIPLALLFFNLGIEVGQVAFVGFLVLSAMLVRMANATGYEVAYRATPWLVGIVSSYWFFERLHGMLFAV